MSNEGYTLAETLAALLILGLSIGGVLSGVRTIGQFERSTGDAHAQSRAIGRVDRTLADLLENRGPYLTDGTGGLIGDRLGLSFPCAASRCSARLEQQSGSAWLVVKEGSLVSRIRAPEGLVFSFETTASKLDHWPDRAASSDWPLAQPLTGLGLVVDRDGQPWAWTPVRKDHLSDCSFDAISRQCREDQP